MSADSETIQHQFEQALLARDRSSVRHILQELSTTHTPIHVIDTLVTPVLERIGNAWEEGTIALSQVYMSGRLCEEMVESMFAAETRQRETSTTMAIVVLHDYHVLGKKIVYSVLRTLGYNIIDYGHGVEVDTLVQQVRRDNIQLLLISTLMLPSAFLVQGVTTQLKSNGSNIKIVVGGAPFRFDTQLWKQVGADAMGASASDAIQLVARFGHSQDG
jgi:methanogenic corrinoid protein MtbC1